MVMVDERPGGQEPSRSDAVAEAHEQAHLAYLKRWVAHGKIGSPLTKDQVIQCIADYPFQDAAGQAALNELLEYPLG